MQRRDSTWMWADACAMVEQAERLHRRFFDLLASQGRESVWEPPVNVLAAEGELQIVFALPGAEPERISIQMLKDGLQVEARVSAPRIPPRCNIVRMELPYGLMRRNITLPPGRYQLTERRLADGCLYLRLTEIRR